MLLCPHGMMDNKEKSKASLMFKNAYEDDKSRSVLTIECKRGTNYWDCKTAQQIKSLAAKPEGQSSIPRMHTVERTKPTSYGLRTHNK